MHLIPELDSSNPFKALHETEALEFQTEKGMSFVKHTTIDFAFGHRRERIDSEDFTFPIASKSKEDSEYFQQELVHLKQSQFEEVRPRRKSSVIQITDPTLLQLEVPLLAVYVQSFNAARN